MPFLAVSICTRNRPEKVRAAIESVLSNSFHDYELLVIDQSSGGATRNVINGYDDSRIKYIHTDTVGLSRSRNIAIRESSAELIVFTDDDCICDKEWLGSIVAEYEHDSNIMGLYGRVLPYEIETNGLICQCLFESLERRIVDKPVIPYDIIGHGNNMSFKKDLFRKIGLYIENLGAGTWMKGGEDTDLIYRALRAGMRICYSPEPLVYHNNWLTVEQSAKLECAYILASVAVFTKHFLESDMTAIKYLHDRGISILYGIYTSIRRPNSKQLGLSFKRLSWYIMGLLMGVKFRFVEAPKL